jgi:hypothetical protein
VNKHFAHKLNFESKCILSNTLNLGTYVHTYVHSLCHLSYRQQDCKQKPMWHSNQRSPTPVTFQWSCDQYVHMYILTETNLMNDLMNANANYRFPGSGLRSRNKQKERVRIITLSSNLSTWLGHFGLFGYLCNFVC